MVKITLYLEASAWRKREVFRLESHRDDSALVCEGTNGEYSPRPPYRLQRKWG